MDPIKLYVQDDFSGLEDILKGEDEIFLVHDRNVSWAAEQVKAVCPVRGIMAIDASEKSKNLDTVTDICRFLLEAGADT